MQMVSRCYVYILMYMRGWFTSSPGLVFLLFSYSVIFGFSQNYTCLTDLLCGSTSRSYWRYVEQRLELTEALMNGVAMTSRCSGNEKWQRNVENKFKNLWWIIKRDQEGRRRTRFKPFSFTRRIHWKIFDPTRVFMAPLCVKILISSTQQTFNWLWLQGLRN